MTDPVFTNWYASPRWGKCLSWNEGTSQLCLHPTKMVFHDADVPPTHFCSFACLGDLLKDLEVAIPVAPEPLVMAEPVTTVAEILGGPPLLDVGAVPAPILERVPGGC